MISREVNTWSNAVVEYIVSATIDAIAQQKENLLREIAGDVAIEEVSERGRLEFRPADGLTRALHRMRRFL